MSNKPKITYLLGAGASAFAVPTIKYFHLLLEKFRLEVNTKLQKVKLSEIERQKVEEKLKLIDEITAFATVDTWARKLFLSKDPKYKQVKELISLFLIYSQFGCTDSIGQIISDQKRMNQAGLLHLSDLEKTQLELMFQRPLDPRYDLFIGSILKHDKSNDILRFPDNINVISWNYDSQFESSLKSFSKSEILRENKMKFEVNKLNGSANFTMVDIDDRSEEAFHFYNNISKNRNFFPRLISILAEQYEYKSEFENNLKFAWEMQTDIITSVSNIIANTDILVVIGYTFPSFNQEVERELFRRNSSIQKVYYQIPENEYEGLLERLKGTIFKGDEIPTYINGGNRVALGSILPVKLVNIKDMNQFYIPNEFYI